MSEYSMLTLFVAALVLAAFGAAVVNIRRKRFQFRLRTLLIVVTVICFGLVLVRCLVWLLFLEPIPKSVVVKDVTKANAFTLVDDDDFQSGVTLHISGEVDGKAVVYHSYEKTVLSGKVDWTSHHDWFKPTFEVRYAPVSVRSGHLTIEYTFR